MDDPLSTEADDAALLQRAQTGDGAAVSEIFDRHRQRLKRMVRLRLNPRLQGRVDPSDVLQEAFMEVAKRLSDYLRAPRAPLYLWLREIAGQKLIDVHRQHLGAQMRDARCEVSLYRGIGPEATSASLAAQLLGRITSPSQAAERAEMRLFLQEALAKMDPLDREVLALRHFEQLTNAEAAQVLQISTSAASKRYIRALERLQEMVGEASDLFL